MNKKCIKVISCVLLVVFLVITCNSVYATDELKLQEYSKEYKEWISLSEEERNNTVMPLNILDNDGLEIDENNNINNVFRLTTALKASYSDYYDLRDVIPENVVVKDQGQTSLCWAFSELANLETYLAKKDKKNNKSTVEYDFSEKHLAYATTRNAFLNDVINYKGIDKEVIGAANYYIGTAYLTNGMGAVSESAMPFDNSFGNIDLNNVTNKNVVTTVDDVRVYDIPETDAQKQERIAEIKEHIVNKGGVSAMIYGATLLNECYNNETAAQYSDDESKYPINHGVLIVGWDDNYSRTNFNSNKRPSHDGAWIVKNSWGTEKRASLATVKDYIFNSQSQSLINIGYLASTEIPDLLILQYYKSIYGSSKVKIENGDLVLEIGDNGFIYVSYDDVNILQGISGIEKASEYKDYDHIYQNEYWGTNQQLYGYVSTSYNKYYIGGVFEKESEDEEVTKVSISTLVPLNECKVLINPNGSEIKLSSMQYVELQEGNYENVKEGYHTIEFANPIKLNGNSFAIVLEFNLNGDGMAAFPVTIASEPFWKDITLEEGKSFAGTKEKFESGNMMDLTSQFNCGIPLKAFTNNIQEESLILSSITIEHEPNKTEYVEGDAFVPDGMIVKANYTNGTSQEITNYVVTNGDVLAKNQSSVTISYTENNITKIKTQTISVSEKVINKVLSDIFVTKAPDNTRYKENDNFNPAGMIVKASYSDGSQEIITDYEIVDGNLLSLEKNTVTIRYTKDGVSKITTQTITVSAREESGNNTEETNEIKLTEIIITHAPNKVNYVDGDSFEKTGMEVKAKYSDNSSKIITNYLVIDGMQMPSGKTEITISYTEGNITKTTTQEVTVVAKQKELPTLSNFENAISKVSSVKGYTYIQKKDKEEYSLIQIDLSGVNIGDSKSTRKFYFYLSNKKGETNIGNEYWTEFELDGSSAKIEIDTRDLPYIDNLSDGDNLFLYVKEVATLGDESSELVSIIDLKNEADIVMYVDDVMQEKKQNNIPQSEEKDKSTATGVLPQTGVTMIFIIIAGIAVVIIAGISFYKYKNVIK